MQKLPLLAVQVWKVVGLERLLFCAVRDTSMLHLLSLSFMIHGLYLAVGFNPFSQRF